MWEFLENSSLAALIASSVRAVKLVGKSGGNCEGSLTGSGGGVQEWPPLTGVFGGGALETKRRTLAPAGAFGLLFFRLKDRSPLGTASPGLGPGPAGGTFFSFIPFFSMLFTPAS